MIEFKMSDRFVALPWNFDAANALMKIVNKMHRKMHVNPKARIRNDRLLKKGMSAGTKLFNLGIEVA